MLCKSEYSLWFEVVYISYLFVELLELLVSITYSLIRIVKYKKICGIDYMPQNLKR